MIISAVQQWDSLSSPTLAQIITRGRKPALSAESLVWLLFFSDNMCGCFDFPSTMQQKLAASDMIRCCNDAIAKGSIKSDGESITARAEPNQIYQAAAFCPNLPQLTETQHHQNPRKTPWLRRGPRARRSIADGWCLLVAVLEGGGRRLVAGEVGDEGVEAVDRHFLCGHHHPADRRGSLPRRATSSPAGAGGTSGAATASWIGRWWWGEEEEVGRGKRACVSSLSISLGESWAFAFVGFPFPMDDFAPGAVGIYVCVFLIKGIYVNLFRW